MKVIGFVHGVVPDYRLPLFDEIARRVHTLKVWSGPDYFAAGIVNAARERCWHRMLVNRFFWGRRLLWQHGVIGPALDAQAVVLELNPRMLSSWPVILARGLRRRRTIFWGHVGKIAEKRSVLGQLRGMMLAFADGFVAYTEAEAVLLRNRGYSKPIWVTNNSCLNRSQCVFSARQQRRTVVYVGRLVAEKKVDLLVRAFAAATDSLPDDIKLLIVGDGPQRDVLERLSAELGISARTEFAGHRSEPDFLGKAYASAFVAASPGYVGLSVIQALGKGVPMLVARDEPHSPEIEACREGINTVFFPSNQVAAAARALADVWTNRLHWEAAGTRIAADIEQRYTYEAMAEALVAAVHGDKPDSGRG